MARELLGTLLHGLSWLYFFPKALTSRSAEAEAHSHVHAGPASHHWSAVPHLRLYWFSSPSWPDLPEWFLSSSISTQPIKIALNLLEWAECPWRGIFFAFSCYVSVVVAATPKGKSCHAQVIAPGCNVEQPWNYSELNCKKTAKGGRRWKIPIKYSPGPFSSACAREGAHPVPVHMITGFVCSRF